MQQFWENPKITHLIFVLEMRTLNFRFEKHLIFIFTNIQHLIFHLIFTEGSSPDLDRHRLLQLEQQRRLPRGRGTRETNDYHFTSATVVRGSEML